MESKYKSPFDTQTLQKKKLNILRHYYRLRPEEVQDWAVDVLWNERGNKDAGLELILEFDWLQKDLES